MDWEEDWLRFDRGVSKWVVIEGERWIRLDFWGFIQRVEACS